MKKIGLLSDTHAYLHPKVFEFFKDVDEIWHAGDIGNIEIAEDLEIFKPLKAVYGNIDDFDVRNQYPKFQLFQCEKVKVLMTHIGGYPGKYNSESYKKIIKEKPQLFISGHSHILKVIYDKKNKLLHMNPGAAGINGLHSVITMIRFTIDYEKIEKLEVLEIKRD